MKTSIMTLIFAVMTAGLVSCGGGGGASSTSGKSLVSITVGGSGETASIKAESDTILAESKLLFKELIKSDEAFAAIPSNVARITFTVSAADMITIIKNDIVSGQTEITETFSIPNGNNRYFLVEAKDADGIVLYRGSTSANLDGNTVTLQINMTELDTTPPSVISANPTGGAAGVPITSPLVITFSESIDPSTFNTATFSLSAGEGNIAGTVTADGALITFTPSAGLAYSTEYTATITSGIKDFSGNTLTDNYTWSFTTVPDSWARTYGLAGEERANSIQQTSDGGYIIAGYTTSSGAGSEDYWILKLGSDGGIQWQKTYGGGNTDIANSIQQTADSGYIVSGYTNSFGTGNNDFWILKLNGEGAVQWQKTYGGVDNDHIYGSSIHQTVDGGYIVAGNTMSFGAGKNDFWILKLNAEGAVQWQKRYGSGEMDIATALQRVSLQQTADNGYIITGYTDSFGGGYDFWVLKLDDSGEIEWQQTYGGNGRDIAYSVQQTADDGYIIAGETMSFGAGNKDFWVLKLDSAGAVQWQKTYGGSNSDVAVSILQTSDEGYVVAGNTASFGSGLIDYWILKLDSTGSVQWQKTYGGANDDDLVSIQRTSGGQYIIAGLSRSFGAGAGDVWLIKLTGNGNIAFNSSSGAGSVDTNATVADTSVTGNDTSITPAATTAVSSDTTATVADTDAIVTQQAP